ncbi:hypothetical protein H0H92_002300 [Tricholoma furcatifolium]|nr:hypothetical protein H0H92_002300 [Tricholoma furcatifolium]
MPKGAGGFKTAALYLDTCSQHVWGFKYKSAGTAKMTGDALMKIFRDFVPFEAFMSDGGSHFDNDVTHVVAPYSPWVNGLVEGANKLLLHVLKRLCSPNLGEDDYEGTDWDDLPASWPNHFDDAIQILNKRILPALKFSPKEILLGVVVNTKPTPVEQSILPVSEGDIATHMAYVAQQRLDGYAEAVAHALDRKSAFDRRVQKKGEVIFLPGDLVQVYRSDLDYTFKSERKLLPKWSQPYRVVSRELNSYRLETTGGRQIEGRFSARRLRRFEPREGTKLAEEQAVVVERRRAEEALVRRRSRGWSAEGVGPRVGLGDEDAAM